MGPDLLHATRPQAHRAALLLHVALVGHVVDDRRFGEEVELGGVGIRFAHHIPSELDDTTLQA